MTSPIAKESGLSAAKLICSGCVGEAYLKALIKDNGVDAMCSYCDGESEVFTIDQVADLVEGAFDRHYDRTSTEPDDFEAAMQIESEFNHPWQRHGQQVKWAIADAADIKEEVAIDIVAVLEDRHRNGESAKMGEERPFAKGSYYEEKNPSCHEFSYEWTEFENRLKTEARFFSRSAQATLAKIFANLQNLKTRRGARVVVDAGPGAKIEFLHRARVFAAENEQLEEALKYPWKHLGPPPMQVASAGRMNARGISVFYGAIESATALAEIRPPVGSQVAVAKFTITRPLKLLDVVALKSVTTAGSIFDPNYLQELQRAKFLEILSGRISRPVMPNEEALEYLATQAVADYLATDEELDGIIFPSVQVGQKASNVVLFHHASRVEDIQLPQRTEISIGVDSRDDGDVADFYQVWEIVTPEPQPKNLTEPGPLDFDIAPAIHESFDQRPLTMKIDLQSVTVHYIKAVDFTAEAFLVGRQRLIDPGGAAEPVSGL